MAAWLEQHKDELMRPWLACIAKAAAAKESAAAQPQAGMAPHKPDVLADAAPHVRPLISCPCDASLTVCQTVMSCSQVHMRVGTDVAFMGGALAEASDVT